MMLDDTDKKLLRELQRDCQQSNQVLAEKIGLSTSVCWRRVKALEEAGIIRRYAAIVDRDKAGLSFTAIVLVSLARQNIKSVNHFMDAISERREIIQCLATTGEADYHLHVACQDQHAFNHFLDHFLFQLEGVSKVQTNVVLKEIKRGMGAPL